MTFTELTTEIAEYLNGFLSPGIDAEVLARNLLSSAEPHDGIVNIEVPARYTASGNPLPTTFDAWEE